jgi:hypothetical protein
MMNSNFVTNVKENPLVLVELIAENETQKIISSRDIQ